MRKGNQVKLIGKYPFCGREGIVKYSWERIYRHTTAEEVQAWRDSPESKGINSAGETKLRPGVFGLNMKEEQSCARIVRSLKMKRLNCQTILLLLFVQGVLQYLGITNIAR